MSKSKYITMTMTDGSPVKVPSHMVKRQKSAGWKVVDKEQASATDTKKPADKPK